MDTREPNLLNVLIGCCLTLIKLISDGGSGLLPPIKWKHAAPLINGFGVSEYFHAGICSRVRERLQSREGNAAVPARDNHRSHCVPYADEVNCDSPRANNASELPSDL